MKTVYVPMVADCLHPGHLNIINIAAGLGEVTVGLFSDEAVASYKRVPYLNYEQRKLVVESIKGVSKVVKQAEKDYEPNLRKYKPDYMVHGTDWLEGPLRAVRDKAIQVMAEWEGKIVEPEYTKGVSSSNFHKDKYEAGITPSERIKSLGKLLDAKPLVRIIGVHDSLSAMVADKTCFINKPGDPAELFDGVLIEAPIDKCFSMNNTASLIAINEILEVTNKPVLYNARELINPEQTILMVKRLERLGVSAIIIEDSGDSSNFFDTISLCLKMRISDDFMIMVSIKNTSEDHDKIINKISSYGKLGIDGIILDSYQSESEISTVFENLSMFAGNKYMAMTKIDGFPISEANARKLGIKMMIYSNVLLRGSISGMEGVVIDLLKNSVY
jgi:phosphoenolpyruvate phosphomutase